MFPNWIVNGGIFDALSDMPWQNTVNPLSVGIAYHGQASGQKYIAPLLYDFLDANGIVTDSGATTIANAIKARYLDKWNHLWNLYQSEYSPLDSYRITETGNESNSKSGTDNSTRTPNLTTTDVLDEDTTDTGTSKSTITHGEKVETQDSTSAESNDYTYGFNTANDDPVPSGRNVSTSGSTGTETHSGDDVTEGESSGTGTRDSTSTRTETGTDTTARTSSESGSGQYNWTRTGNMNHVPAELMSADREFWYDDYFSIVFADLDKMLTLAVMSEYPITHFIF